MLDMNQSSKDHKIQSNQATVTSLGKLSFEDQYFYQLVYLKKNMVIGVTENQRLVLLKLDRQTHKFRVIQCFKTRWRLYYLVFMNSLSNGREVLIGGYTLPDNKLVCLKLDFKRMAVSAISSTTHPFACYGTFNASKIFQGAPLTIIEQAK